MDQMSFITVKEAAKSWKASEETVRRLLREGKIEGAVKQDRYWRIPSLASSPFIEEKIGDIGTFRLSKGYFDRLFSLQKTLDSKRPLPQGTLKSLKEYFNLLWTYNSNGIEGNTLTLNETQVVLEGITVGGKTIREHLEVIGHEAAILYLDDLVKEISPITEHNIKDIHYLILKAIDREHAGVYRKENVIISKSKHIPPDYIIVPEKMEKLIEGYKTWEKYNPIVKAAILHEELVKIHPFVDGNGRTSRLVMNLSLMKDGLLPVVIKKDERKKYYAALQKADEGDYTNLIKMVTASEIETLETYLKLIK